MIRDIVIARIFGAGLAADAFLAAFKIPNLLRRLVAEGSLAPAFVPTFTEELDKSDDAGQQALGEATGFCLVLTLSFAALGMLFAEELTVFFAPGFAPEPGKLQLSASLLRTMFPYIVLVSLLALASSTLNALGRFALPAASPAILNVCLISAALFFSSFFQEPIRALSWGVLAGGVLGLIPQIWLLKRLGYSLRWKSPFGSAVVGRLLRLMLPSVLSASLYQIMVFVNLALASLLVEGSVSWLYYADRLFQFPLGVFSIAIGTAVLPSLSRMAVQNQDEDFRAQLLLALEWITFITIPAAVGLIVLSEPIIAVILEGGSFTAVDTVEASAALEAFAIGLWSTSSQIILVRAFLAKKNTLLPAVVSSMAILSNIALALALMGPAASPPENAIATTLSSWQEKLELYELGHVGLALAGSLASYLSLFALTLLLPRIRTKIPLGALGKQLFRALVSALVMAGAINAYRHSGENDLLDLVFLIPLGALIYFLCSLLMRSPQAISCLKTLAGLTKQ